MKEVLVKKNGWKRTLPTNFVNEHAVKQIEISSGATLLTSEQNPINGDSMLYDKLLPDLDLNVEDFISKEEFTKAWNDNV